MMPMMYSGFEAALEDITYQMQQHSEHVENQKWQSISVTNPLMQTREVMNTSFTVALPENAPLDYYRAAILPNLPWADTAFQERVDGIPWNPGKAWESWPYARSAANFRREENFRYSHSYAERYWPKWANDTIDAEWSQGYEGPALDEPKKGIRYVYGDLNDVLFHLSKDPLSRQAYLPVWFPEDTGVVHGERVPCTLGYHFMQRKNRLHCTYYIRSCDFVRHLRDDLYMSVRLQQWLLDKLKERGWPSYIGMGLFTFHCVSLHMFVNDWNHRFGKKA